MLVFGGFLRTHNFHIFAFLTSNSTVPSGCGWGRWAKCLCFTFSSENNGPLGVLLKEKEWATRHINKARYHRNSWRNQCGQVLPHTKILPCLFPSLSIKVEFFIFMATNIFWLEPLTFCLLTNFHFSNYVRKEKRSFLLR